MGGILVKQALPTLRVEQVDPYLLLHHGRFEFPNGGKAVHQGIGPHPHRGFSPVTFIIEGELHHRDSFGHSQVAYAGDVQWMDAGAGIVHSERPSQALVDRKGTQEVVQIWINTHSSRKLLPPSYQYTPASEMPDISPRPDLFRIGLVTGRTDTDRGPVHSAEDLWIGWGHWAQSASYTWKLEAGTNAMIYVLRGSLRIPTFGRVEAEQLVVCSAEGKVLEIQAEAGTQCLLLAGRPLDEKIVSQGPFVMNNETQILEAMRDYQMGKMGILIEE